MRDKVADQPSGWEDIRGGNRLRLMPSIDFRGSYSQADVYGRS
jgi:hypothetical protein